MRPIKRDLTLLLAVLACAADAAEFKTTALAKADVTRSVELLGEVRPYRQVTLTAKWDTLKLYGMMEKIVAVGATKMKDMPQPAVGK